MIVGPRTLDIFLTEQTGENEDFGDQINFSRFLLQHFQSKRLPHFKPNRPFSLKILIFINGQLCVQKPFDENIVE